MNPRVPLLLLFSLTMFGQKSFVPLDESDKEGTLEVLFVTAWGDVVLNGPNVTVEKMVDGKSVSTRRGERTMKLKYGTYRLRVQYSGAYPVDRSVTIQNPYQAISICFFIAPIELPWDGNLIRGRISEKSRQKDCRWIRFIFPFANGEAAETKASETGYFALENVRPGRYLALTIGKSGICEMAEVTILFGKPVYDLSISWAAPPAEENTPVQH